MLQEKFQGHSKGELNYQVMLLLVLIFTFTWMNVMYLGRREKKERGKRAIHHTNVKTMKDLSFMLWLDTIKDFKTFLSASKQRCSI